VVQQAETGTTVCEFCGREGDPIVIAYCCLSGD